MMKKHLSILATALLILISIPAYAEDMELNNSDVYIAQDEIKLGTGSNEISLKRNGNDLDITLPASDGTAFIKFLNLAGDTVMSISDSGIIQSTLTNGFTFVDPFSITDTVYLNLAKTVYFSTQAGDNLFAFFENSATYNIDFQGDNDGTSGLEITNSDDKKTFSTYSNGYTIWEIPIESTTIRPLHVMDYAGQGTAIGGYTHLDELYTDRDAVHRIDMVAEGGVAFDIRNSNNATRRLDKGAGYYGSNHWFYLTDETGTFYKNLFDATAGMLELYLRSATWKIQHNGTGLNPAQEWRTFGTNTSDYRWQNINGYVDFKRWDNGGSPGLEYATSATATGGLKITATNGDLDLAANGDITLESTTGNIVTPDTFQAPTIQGSSVSGNDLTLNSNSSNDGSVKIGTMAEFDENANTLNVVSKVIARNTANTLNTVALQPSASQFNSGAVNIYRNGVVTNGILLDAGDNAASYFAPGNPLGLGILTPEATLHVKGSGNTSATYAAIIENSDGVDIAKFRDDGFVSVKDSLVDSASTWALTTFGVLTDSGGVIGWGNSTAQATSSTNLRRPETGIILQSGSTVSQEYRIANTTDYAGNGEFASLGWKNEANSFGIETEAEGTGTLRDLYLNASNIRIKAPLKLESSVRNKVTDVSTTSYTVLSSDYTVSVSHSAAATETITLPPLSTAWDATTNTGQVVIIKDSAGDAGTYTITINEDATDTNSIDGAASATITTNYNSLTFQATSATTWGIF